jgi:hypothetical protein
MLKGFSLGTIPALSTSKCNFLHPENDHDEKAKNDHSAGVGGRAYPFIAQRVAG